MVIITYIIYRFNKLTHFVRQHVVIILTDGNSMIAWTYFMCQLEFLEKMLCIVVPSWNVCSRWTVSRDLTGYQLPPLPYMSHFIVSDSPHPPSEAVPSAEHLLPPTVTPVHIPLPGEEEVSWLNLFSKFLSALATSIFCISYSSSMLFRQLSPIIRNIFLLTFLPLYFDI